MNILHLGCLLDTPSGICCLEFKREVLISKTNLETVNVQMEFKGKRLYEITKEVGFNRKETGTKDCILGYPTSNVRKMMKNQQTGRGRTASW